MNYVERHEQLYEFIKNNTLHENFDLVCDVIYKIILTNDIYEIQKRLKNYCYYHNCLDGLINNEDSYHTLMFSENCSKKMLENKTYYQTVLQSHKIYNVPFEMYYNELFLKQLCDFIETCKPVPPSVTYGKVVLYRKIKHELDIMLLIDEIRNLPDDFDYYLHQDCPTELIKNMSFIDKNMIEEYKNTNNEIMLYKQELLKNNYSNEFLGYEGVIFSDKVDVLHFNTNNNINVSEFKSVEQNCSYLESYLFSETVQTLQERTVNNGSNEFIKKYGVSNLKSSLFVSETNMMNITNLTNVNNSIKNNDQKKLTLTIYKNYDDIKNLCKEKYDKCYSDSNRKRLFQIAYSNNGCIIEAKLNNKKYGTIEIIFSKKGLIVMKPHCEFGTVVKKDQFSLTDICVKSLAKMTNCNIYVISPSECNLAFKNISFLNTSTSNTIDDLKKEMLQLKDIELYYDLFEDTKLYQIDINQSNTLDYSLRVQCETAKLKEKINKLIPIEYIKFKKSIMQYIDDFVHSETDPTTFMNAKFQNNKIPTMFLTQLSLNLFDIQKINNNDSHAIYQIYQMEQNNFGNTVFDFDNIEGFILWSHVHSKIFGYIITEKKTSKKLNQKYLMIHSVLITEQFRQYGLMSHLYGVVAKYYVLNEKMNFYKMYLPSTSKSNEIVNMFCKIASESTCNTFNYKILKTTNDNDIKYLIYIL